MTQLVILVVIAAASLALVLSLRKGRRRAAAAPPRGMGSAARRAAAGRPFPAAAADAGGDAKLNWLVGTGGPVEGMTFHVGYRTATIGRAATNLVQVDHPDVSRKHCQLVARDGGLQVVDMQSHNGTFVNDAPVAQGALRAGDELRVGPARFVFRLHVAGASDAARQQKRAGEEAAKATVARSGGGLEAHIRSALRRRGGDVRAAAADLGVDPAILERIIAEKGIDRTT